ncbi:hypothetical protein [Methylobacterium tarhaniae]|nr:hypothetical protein [Methylobacterium tarhaniae]
MSPVKPWRQGPARILPLRTVSLIVAGLVIALVGIFFALEDVIPTPFR